MSKIIEFENKYQNGVVLQGGPITDYRTKTHMVLEFKEYRPNANQEFEEMVVKFLIKPIQSRTITVKYGEEKTFRYNGKTWLIEFLFNESLIPSELMNRYHIANINFRIQFEKKTVEGVLEETEGYRDVEFNKACFPIHEFVHNYERTFYSHSFPYAIVPMSDQGCLQSDRRFLTFTLNFELIPNLNPAPEWSIYSIKELLKSKKAFDVYMHDSPPEKKKYDISTHPELKDLYMEWKEKYINAIKIIKDLDESLTEDHTIHT